MNEKVKTNTEMLQSAISGLSATPKTLESKWFYDPTGSALFEDITQLPEYYPTRTEVDILRANYSDIAKHIPQDCALVELGSGASTKTQILLDGLPQVTTYVPLDISAEFLAENAERLRAEYPALDVRPVTGDFMRPVHFPEPLQSRAKTCFFPGSTLGNLAEDSAISLLKGVRRWPMIQSFVLGIDLVKDPARLVRAYDDAQGVTAAFNLNVLRRLNRELEADFDLDDFAHEARWNADLARIEMHLRALKTQSVTIGAYQFDFAQGETIHTENSHKYTRSSVDALAAASGWRVVDFFTDADADFAISVLVPDGD